MSLGVFSGKNGTGNQAWMNRVLNTNITFWRAPNTSEAKRNNLDSWAGMINQDQSVSVPPMTRLTLINAGGSNSLAVKGQISNTTNRDIIYNTSDIPSITNSGNYCNQCSDDVYMEDIPPVNTCCLGTTSDCSAYSDLSAGGAVCTHEIMSNICSAGTEESPLLISNERCKSWCSSNLDKCDAAKLSFCEKYPNSSYCRCINGGSQPEYKKLMDSDSKKLLASAPVSCFVQSTCPQSNDLVNTLKTTSIQRTVCPDINAVVQSIHAGKDVIIKDSVLSGEATSASASVAAQTNLFDNTTIMVCVVFLLFMALVFVALLVTKFGKY